MMKTKLLMPLLVLALTACTTTFENNKVDYKSQGRQGPGLEVPPDLSQLTKNAEASVPVGGAANASSYLKSANSNLASSFVPASKVAASELGDVRLQRGGAQRWLVVNRPPEKLWDDVKIFWADNGFTLVIDQPNLGIMETEWLENRAKLPQDGVRKYLGSILGSLFSTNQRDKYRTRMERAANGGTEIYISHRGLEKNFIDSQHTQLAWMPRPIDPELEAEFLNRLMIKLGGVPVVATAASTTPLPTASTPLAPAPQDNRARLVQDGTQTNLVVNDELDQAWRRVGLSLDRANFTVEDRDRSKGVYFVRYVDPNAEKNAPGFFAKMFGAKEKESLQKYQIIVTGESNRTRVKVANEAGQVLDTADAKNILKVLLDDLK